MRIRVNYPIEDGQLVLRSDADWDADIAACRVAASGAWHEFHLGDVASFRYFKPVLRQNGHCRWAQGANNLVLGSATDVTEVFPYFREDLRCHECDRYRVPSRIVEQGIEVRVFLPPGYDENTLESFPVLYMQDGHNLFFPEEAYGGRHWQVAETLRVLDSMSLIRKVIVVGIYPLERDRQYTAPGYETYARVVVDELKPWVDAHYRTRHEAADTGVLGSSLGGVVSLYLAWRNPEVFGNVGAMSSTFGYRDDLFGLVLDRPAKPLRIYLDSGWPGDNYEATRAMHAALASRGFVDGRDVQYLAFPHERHDEASWAARLHLPFQFFFRIHTG